MRDYRLLLQRILHAAIGDACHVDFLLEIANQLLDFSESDAVLLRIGREGRRIRCQVVRDYELSPQTLGKRAANRRDARFSSSVRIATEPDSSVVSPLDAEGQWLSQVSVPLVVAEESVGLLQLASRVPDHFQPVDVECYRDIAEPLGLALLSQQTRASLRERIKELTCLYGIAQLAERRGVRIGRMLQEIVECLPLAWQYPEIAAARIIFDGERYETPGFERSVQKQTADLVVDGQSRGAIEVGYKQAKPHLDEGPFLREERSLIDTVARQIAILIERRQAAKAKRRLQRHLRHADRLATIGQLSAGVAHELNEPLGNILAFAQLAAKESDVPPQVARDLGKIVKTSLYARDILKKLMLFAREMPPQKTPVDLNQIIDEALPFFDSRCEKQSVTVHRRLAPGLPKIVADPSQLHQVLVNLLVNAFQAMPSGGNVWIGTRTEEQLVVLAIEDDGVGMSPKVLKKIFIPFFTTKDVHEGTGLGLAVVHGIVTSHGGVISVESTAGHGARFEIRFPQAPQQPVEEEVLP